MPFAAMWMDLENVMLSEVSQAEKEKHPLTPLKCGIQKEMIQMILFTKQRLTDLEDKRMVVRGKGQLGSWDGHVHTAIFKIDYQKEPTIQHMELC